MARNLLDLRQGLKAIGVIVSITKKPELADSVGSAREVVRVIVGLRDDGLLSRDRDENLCFGAAAITAYRP